MVSLVGEIDTLESLPVDLRELSHEWLQATGELAGRVVGPVFVGRHLGPDLGGAIERVVDVTRSIMVDDRIAGRITSGHDPMCLGRKNL